MRIICIMLIALTYSATLSNAEVLLQESNFTYEGAFRVPGGFLGGDSAYSHTLARGGSGLTYNPNNNSLIMISRGSEKLAVEISIPAARIEASIADLNVAALVQVPGNVAQDQWDYLALDGTPLGNGGSVGGLLVYNNKLIGLAYGYYDGDNEGIFSIPGTSYGSTFAFRNALSSIDRILVNAAGTLGAKMLIDDIDIYSGVRQP